MPEYLHNPEPRYFGYTLDQWKKAKEEMQQILIGRAKAGVTICYSELVAQVRAIKMEPDSYALPHMLGEISSEEDGAGRGMLTVLVVHKDSDMEPGRGFFELARQRGHDISDPLKFWVAEMNRVCSYWARK